MKLVLLWSDLLIFLLVAMAAGYAVWMSRLSQDQKKLAQEKWSALLQDKLALLCLLVVISYALVALLDSIHFRLRLDTATANGEQQYSHEVSSVLDALLLDLKTHQEKTYSQPFAIVSFAKEDVTTQAGQHLRDYPRLVWGGRHLANISELPRDLSLRLMQAITTGLGFGLVLAFLINQLRYWRGEPEMPSHISWSTVYAYLVICCVFVSLVLQVGSVYHLLGTDKVGNDVLYLSIKSIRTGILIGTLSTLLTLPFAITFGIAAGYFRGWVDDVVQYVYTTLSSIPDILLIAAAVLVLDVWLESHAESFELLVMRTDIKFLALCFILGLTSWTGLCRLLRAETLKVSQLDYVQAARVFGVSHAGVIYRHILPNVMHLVLISLVMNFSGAVMAESILSYIGIGVDPSMVSWGNMINAARQELSREPTVWWTITAVFILMLALVLAANLLADRVRDVFDPRNGSAHS